jgi:hypothetical protein
MGKGDNAIILRERSDTSHQDHLINVDEVVIDENERHTESEKA